MRDAQLTSQFAPALTLACTRVLSSPSALIHVLPMHYTSRTTYVVLLSIPFSTSGSLKDSLSKYGQHIDSRIKQRLMQMKAGGPSRMRSCATKNGGISNAT
jgi:hypothetical protein